VLLQICLVMPVQADADLFRGEIGLEDLVQVLGGDPRRCPGCRSPPAFAVERKLVSRWIGGPCSEELIQIHHCSYPPVHAPCGAAGAPRRRPTDSALRLMPGPRSGSGSGSSLHVGTSIQTSGRFSRTPLHLDVLFLNLLDPPRALVQHLPDIGRLSLQLERPAELEEGLRSSAFSRWISCLTVVVSRLTSSRSARSWADCAADGRRSG